ncbi:DNA-directed RNA polymerase sigma-70 factor [Actinocatenispora thailandica]|uniref:DNA-directed RNA polymerase sigma-70 factor n=1 Tax=Actinocatenispora thailandica TaxID=227318 RepID=A0A7R7HZA3_9ACTN|nr:sigma-70 family RNA polymerase sigma factor [Actinocatenispora thailandica]BCJ36923.1 DNA-directed RNA polymerase sigma-70 factor [Actinocatenispora thailandica]
MEELAEGFERARPRLRAVAYRMLGSASEADDAVQEAWLRLSRADRGDVRSLPAWLTTVVARICLNMLQARQTRREQPLEDHEPPAGGADPAAEAELTESVGLALSTVLDRLAPAERLAFVLHDMFAVPFDEIADIAGRSPAAVRQLASRARRRVRESGARPEPDRARQRTVVQAFLAASRNGDFAALLALLDPDAVLRADAAAVATGASTGVVGAAAVAEQFAGRARAARFALVDGAAALVWSVGGEVRVVFTLTVVGDRITEIEILADPARLRALDVVLPDRVGSLPPDRDGARRDRVGSLPPDRDGARRERDEVSPD